MTAIKQQTKDLSSTAVKQMLTAASAVFVKEEGGKQVYSNKATALTFVVIPKAGSRGLDRVIITQGACVC